MRKTAFDAAVLAAALFLPLAAYCAEPVQHDSIFPPWQHGENNDATQRGLSFTVPQVDDLADFHGNVSDPKLVLYVGGNYFFAMAPLVAEFEQQHPEFKGRIYWETLPPGLLEKQMEAGGTVTSGNMTWTAKPDAYLAGLKKVQGLIDQGALTGPAVALRDQYPDDHGAGGQSGPCQRSLRSGAARPSRGHAESRVRRYRPADRGLAEERRR